MSKNKLNLDVSCLWLNSFS